MWAMRMFVHKNEEWLVEPAGTTSSAGGANRLRVRFVSKATRREAFGHVAARMGDLESVPDAELSKSLEAGLADQSLG